MILVPQSGRLSCPSHGQEHSDWKDSGPRIQRVLGESNVRGHSEQAHQLHAKLESCQDGGWATRAAEPKQGLQEVVAEL